jgi:glutamyl/glutaminyl-tRNA synthetase
VRELSPAELTAELERFTGREGIGGAVAISAEKLQTLADFWPLAGFIFDGPDYDPAAVQRWLGEAGRAVLVQTRKALAELDEFDLTAVERALRGVVEGLGLKPKDVFQPLRVALAGRPVSPGIFETVVVLGRDAVLERIDRTLETTLETR